MRSPDSFGMKFSNIPTMNLRLEFNDTYRFVFSVQAEQALNGPVHPVRTPMFIWGGMPEDLFTLLLQRAVLGVEAYLPGALMHAAAQLGVASKELFAKLHDPFSFGARSAATNIFHRMPAAVHEELSLKHLDQVLYEATVRFYREVRNPLFHGGQLESHTSIASIRGAFEHLASLYEWIDHWHNPELLLPGFGRVAGIRKSRAAPPAGE